MAEFIRIIIFGLLSSMLIFIGKDAALFSYLKQSGILAEGLDTNHLRYVCFFAGILIAGLWIPIQYAILRKKCKRDRALLKDLLRENKRNYFNLIIAELEECNITFNTRIFKPQKGLIGWWNKYVKNKIRLCLCSIEGISDNFHHKTLHFDVTETCVQGMVGKSFKEKALYIDFDLDNNNYNLTETQRIKIGNLQFCSTIPIFDSNQSKILAILSVDSDSKLTFTKEQKEKWERHMIYYAAFVDKHSNL